MFATCYCNVNAPDIGQDLIKIFEHNGIPLRLTERGECCGMPKFEQGDLDSVDKYRRSNIPQLVQLIEAGWDIVAPIPSCVLMFKQELPLMFPDDADIQKVKQHIFDPFEYLLHRHKAGLLNTAFKQELGKVAWHVPCHQRVQNIGPKTKDILSLVPGTEIEMIERCSGHDGTYGVRAATYEKSQKIARAAISRVKKTQADYLVSDCPMAATQIARRSGTEARRNQPADPAPKGLWNLNARGVSRASHASATDILTGKPMKPLTRQDLMSLEEYAEQRDAFRARVIEHKKDRRVDVGPNLSLYFEDRLTIQYQVQEMLRIEKIFEAAAIKEELDAYNPLIPDGSNWKATAMLEFEDVDVRRQRLAELVGMERLVWMRVDGQDKVFAIANEDLERSTDGEDFRRAFHAL